MRWSGIARSVVSLTLFAGVRGYGTTVSIAVSYCPASSTLATGTANPSPTTSGTPTNTPVLIYVVQGLSKRADLQYVSSLGGTINTNPGFALTWMFTSAGELMTEDGRFISVTGSEPQRFFPAVPKIGISMTWGVDANRTVSWKNENFPTGQAGFCLMDSNVWIYFEQPPTGCTAVTLGAIPKEDVVSPVSSTSGSATQVSSSLGTASPSATSVPGTIAGALATAEPVGCMTSSIGSLALNSGNTTVSKLEQCVDVCAAYISSGTDYHYVGVQFGDQCYCGSSLNPVSEPASPESCNIPCGGDSEELCGGNTAMSIYVIVLRTPTSSSTVLPSGSTTTGPSGTGYPTTTGDPNCFDGSGYDGTINNNYLILCDTSLPGYDLDSVDAQDLAECIEECGSYAPSGNGDRCVAVEYDILVSQNPCTLKSAIGPIDRGGNIFAQAAILRDLPGAPSITFGSSTVGPTSVSTSTTLSIVQLSTTVISTTITLSSSLVITSTRASTSSSLATLTTTSTSHVTTTSRTTTNSPPSSSPSSPTISPRTSTTTLTASSFTPTSGYPTPTASLCPTYNHQILNVNSDGYPYEVECGTTLIGAVLNGNSTTAASLSDCVSFCTLYNIALPYQCLGVSFLGLSQSGAANCFLLGSITGTVCTPGTDGARLVWAQYSAVSDQICGSMPSSPSMAPSSSTTRAQSSSLVATITSAQSSSPTTTASSVVSTSTSSRPATSSPSPSTALTSTSRSTASSVSPSTSASPSSSTSRSSITSASASTSTSTSRPTSSPSSSSFASATTTTATTPVASSSTSAASSTITTPASSTTPFSQSPCSAPPTGTDGYNTECPSPTPTPNPNPSPQCYYYNFTQQAYPSTNYEIECASSFSGASLQPLLTFDLEDCIYYCQNANYLAGVANPNAPPGCVGVTFDNTPATQGGNNNCLRYSSIGCVTRGNSTFDSARLLYSGYQAIVDYGPGYACPP